MTDSILNAIIGGLVVAFVAGITRAAVSQMQESFKEAVADLKEQFREAEKRAAADRHEMRDKVHAHEVRLTAHSHRLRVVERHIGVDGEDVP